MSARGATKRDLFRVIDERADEITRLKGALRKIAEGRGRFSRDPLTFATNVIEDMKGIATSALEDKWTPDTGEAA